MVQSNASWEDEAVLSTHEHTTQDCLQHYRRHQPSKFRDNANSQGSATDESQRNLQDLPETEEEVDSGYRSREI